MNAVLFWLTRNLADVPQNDDWLSEGELGVLAGLRFPKRRNDWRLGRWTAKQAICIYEARNDLSSLEIRAAADGAPVASWDGHPANAVFSISHSGDRGLCVVAPHHFMVGCDLERVESREDIIVRDYFTPEEISFCVKAPPEGKFLAVNLVWSAKESTLKALREGLRRDTRSISIHTDLKGREGGWNTWKGICVGTSRAFYGWWRSCDDYIYTIASDQLTSVPIQLPVITAQKIERGH
jgi:4'-phosphopantetheinyl transferase